MTIELQMRGNRISPTHRMVSASVGRSCRVRLLHTGLSELLIIRCIYLSSTFTDCSTITELVGFDMLQAILIVRTSAMVAPGRSDPLILRATTACTLSSSGLQLTAEQITTLLGRRLQASPVQRAIRFRLTACPSGRADCESRGDAHAVK